MSHYTIDELITRWKREEMTAEQIIGQMLQLMKEQEQRLRESSREPSAVAASRADKLAK